MMRYIGNASIGTATQRVNIAGRFISNRPHAQVRVGDTAAKVRAILCTSRALNVLIRHRWVNRIDAVVDPNDFLPVSVLFFDLVHKIYCVRWFWNPESREIDDSEICQLPADPAKRCRQHGIRGWPESCRFRRLNWRQFLPWCVDGCSLLLLSLLGGVDNEYDEHFETNFQVIYNASSLQVPWYFALGNHDYKGNISGQLHYKGRRYCLANCALHSVEQFFFWCFQMEYAGPKLRLHAEDPHREWHWANGFFLCDRYEHLLEYATRFVCFFFFSAVVSCWL